MKFYKISLLFSSLFIITAVCAMENELCNLSRHNSDWIIKVTPEINDELSAIDIMKSVECNNVNAFTSIEVMNERQIATIIALRAEERRLREQENIRNNQIVDNQLHVEQHQNSCCLICGSCTLCFLAALCCPYISYKKGCIGVCDRSNYPCCNR